MNLITSFIIFSLISSVLSGSIYGVSDEDWVSYQIFSEWEIDGEDFSDLLASEMYLEFQEVYDDDVRALLIQYFLNGSSTSYYQTLNQSGYGNFWLIPSGLDDQSIFDNMAVNYSYSDNVFGELRTLNVFDRNYVSLDFEEHVSIVWDKNTGIMLQMFIEIISFNEYYSVNFYAVDTSLWPLETINLSSSLSENRVSKGDSIEVEVSLSDSSQVPIVGASVSLKLASDTKILVDQGDGRYLETIDTSSLDAESYTVELSATKSGYETTGSNQSIEITESFPFDSEIILKAGSALLVLLAILVFSRVRKKKKIEDTLPINVQTPKSYNIRPRELPRELEKRTIEDLPETHQPDFNIQTIEKSSEIQIEEQSTEEIIESYNILRKNYESSKISEADFNEAINEFRFTDNAGVLWSLGGESGSWYKLDGDRWIPDTPNGKLKREN